MILTFTDDRSVKDDVRQEVEGDSGGSAGAQPGRNVLGAPKGRQEWFATSWSSGVSNVDRADIEESCVAAYLKCSSSRRSR